MQETWKQHVTGGKLREITEEAKAFAMGNKALAALFVHTPAGELQRQIRSWLAENFEFLSVTEGDAVGGTTGQLELLSTAIMDGWMAGLGAAQPPSTDALGQLLAEYTKRVYTSQLQHLKVQLRAVYLFSLCCPCFFSVLAHLPRAYVNHSLVSPMFFYQLVLHVSGKCFLYKRLTTTSV